MSLTKLKYFDILLLIIFVSLGLITFSRGGMLASIIALSIAISWKLFHYKNNYRFIINMLSIVTISSVAWLMVVDVTGNMITKRYGVVNFIGEVPILDLTGRAEIYSIDFKIFRNNILTGVGPGMAYFEREKYGYGKKISAHTEYSRMLAEHGLLGGLALFSLLVITFKCFILLPNRNKDIIIVMGVLALLTLFHSAMRLAMPSLAFALLFPTYES
tara:strand:- start:36 stop:683 length:648 start_codon:yes stop_codon:yes gene_type:complete